MCTTNGDISAPIPKHRWSRFIARPDPAPSSHISNVLPPRSQIEPPKPITTNVDEQRR